VFGTCSSALLGSVPRVSPSDLRFINIPLHVVSGPVMCVNLTWFTHPLLLTGLYFVVSQVLRGCPNSKHTRCGQQVPRLIFYSAVGTLRGTPVCRVVS
jgi:hypothetical protein